jgi:hypothetical protein
MEGTSLDYYTLKPTFSFVVVLIATKGYGWLYDVFVFFNNIMPTYTPNSNILSS